MIETSLEVAPKPKAPRVSTRQKKLVQLLQTADEAEAQKEFETAISALTEAQSIDPSFEERLKALRKQLEAAKSKREHQSEGKKEIAELLEYGHLAESKADFQEAALALEKVQLLDVGPVEIGFNIADKLGELRMKAALDPGVRSKELWKQAEEAEARKDWDSAVVALEEATKLNSGYGSRLKRMIKIRDDERKVNPRPISSAPPTEQQTQVKPKKDLTTRILGWYGYLFLASLSGAVSFGINPYLGLVVVLIWGYLIIKKMFNHQ